MRILSRRPFTLYSYLATEMLAPFFASFLVMNGVFFLIRLIPFLNFALDLNIGGADFLRLFSYMLPKMMIYTIPMSAMMGVIICFSRLSNDTEILAMKAGGISIFHILPPLLLITGAITLITAYISLSLIPESEASMKRLSYQLLKEKMDQGIKEYQFTEALGDLVVHVGSINKKNGDWQDVWVSDKRDRLIPAITMASQGRMVGDFKNSNMTIILENGSMHRPDGKNAQVISFKRYVINVPLHLPAPNPDHLKPKTLKRLLELAEKRGLDNEPGRDMLVEFHKRFSMPAGTLVLALIGLPLGLLAGPGKKAIGIPIGLFVFVLYFVTFSTLKNMAEDGVAPIAFLMWLPNTCFLLFAIYAINRVAQEREIVPHVLSGLFQSITRRLFSPLVRLFQPLLRKAISSPDEEVPRPHAEHLRPSNDVIILGDPQLNVCHLSHCSKLDHHCTVRFDDISEARDAGFSLCPHCQSDLAEQGEKDLE